MIIIMLTGFFNMLRDKGEAQERYDAGALLFARGDEVESLYVLEHGEIMLSRSLVSGRELVLHRSRHRGRGVGLFANLSL